LLESGTAAVVIVWRLRDYVGDVKIGSMINDVLPIIPNQSF
jgi:hypothetical protein